MPNTQHPASTTSSLARTRHVGGDHLRQGRGRLQQRSLVGSVVDELHEGDTVRVLVASQPNRWLGESGLNFTPAVRNELKHKLRDIPASLATADLNAALLQAIEAEASDVRAKRIITLITDAQAYGWRAEASAAWAINGKGIVFMIQDGVSLTGLQRLAGDAGREERSVR